MNLSVVMAVFNSEEYLRESIDSILAQTYRDFEFIIVNDGSKDKTKEILEQIDDHRVKIVNLKKNIGLAGALNVGIEQASGDWIARHDADDISLPTRFEEQMIYLKSHPDVVAVATLIQNIPGKTPIQEHELRAAEIFHNALCTREKISQKRFYGCPICSGTTVFSKKVFKQIGGYNPKYRLCEDYDLWLRMFEIGTIDILPKILYQYRVQQDSLSRINWIETTNKLMMISSRYIRKYFISHTKVKPRFVVVGTKNACKNFKNHICPVSKLRVLRFYSDGMDENIEAAYHLWKKGKADGVIVLDGGSSDQVLDCFHSKGLKINETLFHLYNAVT